MKEIKQYLHKWKPIHCSWVGRIDTVNISEFFFQFYLQIQNNSKLKSNKLLCDMNKMIFLREKNFHNSQNDIENRAKG